MNGQNSLPVIVGSSASGVLVSLALSRAGVEHIMIGGPEPDDLPRLGESLNECASPELFGEFGEELIDCFYPKSHISLLNGDFATQVVVANPGRCRNKAAKQCPAPSDADHSTWKTFWNCVSGRNLMHVDRTKFDKALYWKSREHNCCEFVEAMVERVVESDDRVEQLILDNGRIIQNPKFVFDATGFRQVIGAAFNVKTTPISDLNRVVWTHYSRDSSEPCPQRWWNHGTNLLKLEHNRDGLAGISWFIPLGNTVSIGVSVSAEQYSSDRYSDTEVMRLTNEAYVERGVDYSDLFPDHTKPIQQLTHKYYVRERAYGRNWLLVGGTFMSVWFPSSAGLWSVTAANCLIPRILDDPLKYGAEYEAALSQLTVFHRQLDRMINGPSFERSRDAYRFWAQWLSGVPWRTGEYLRLVSEQRGERTRFGFLAQISILYQRSPVAMLLLWGVFVLRIVRQPKRSLQSKTLQSSLYPFRYRVGNYSRGIATFWRS